MQQLAMVANSIIVGCPLRASNIPNKQISSNISIQSFSHKFHPLGQCHTYKDPIVQFHTYVAYQPTLPVFKLTTTTAQRLHICTLAPSPNRMQQLWNTKSAGNRPIFLQRQRSFKCKRGVAESCGKPTYLRILLVVVLLCPDPSADKVIAYGVSQG